MPGESEPQTEQLDKYRTGPMRFPLHVLDEDGDALCGSMADDQERFIERHGVENQATLQERVDENDAARPLMSVLSGLCGNCRRSLLSEEGTQELQEAWNERQRLIQEVEA